VNTAVHFLSFFSDSLNATATATAAVAVAIFPFLDFREFLGFRGLDLDLDLDCRGCDLEIPRSMSGEFFGLHLFETQTYLSPNPPTHLRAVFFFMTMVLYFQ
jgi:hypothetical protein